jgi:predicted secreted protein
VSYNAESIGANGLKVACPRLKEVEETLVTERMVTCDEILGNVSSLNNLCVSFIDSARQDNVNLATVQDTGETISSCEQ